MNLLLSISLSLSLSLFNAQNSKIKTLNFRFVSLIFHHSVTTIVQNVKYNRNKNTNLSS